MGVYLGSNNLLSGGSNILESLYFTPDGRTVSTAKGNVTAGNVTAKQTFNSTSPAVFTNCDFSYTPPDGATKVLMEFTFQGRHIDSGNMYALPTVYGRLAGTVVTDSKWGSYQYSASTATNHSFNPTIYVEINIGGSDDIANNSVSSWTTSKTFSFIGMSFDSNQHAWQAHNTRYGSPTSGNFSDTNSVNMPPKYKITAYK